ncbi:DUF4278 domain-containing protein [Cyanobacteria bacterium FACHB-471]|nr:DUF4278 domain-containing protein [Cyanobacteria bacterium FACHB-471]
MKLCYRGTDYTTKLTATSNAPQRLILTQYRGVKQQVTVATRFAGVQVSHPLTYRGTVYSGL